MERKYLFLKNKLKLDIIHIQNVILAFNSRLVQLECNLFPISDDLNVGVDLKHNLPIHNLGCHFILLLFQLYFQ